MADLWIVGGHRRGYLSYAETGFQHARVISVLSAAGEQFAVTVRKAAAPRGFRGAAGDHLRAAVLKANLCVIAHFGRRACQNRLRHLDERDSLAGTVPEFAVLGR